MIQKGQENRMKIMAIDYGDARTGAALSDAEGRIVGQTSVVPSYNTEKALAALAAMAEENGVERIVVGLPRNMDGSEGERAAICRAFAARLAEVSGHPVELWDERCTTVDAHRILSENGRFGKKRKERVDAVAASLILEGYLDYQRRVSKD